MSIMQSHSWSILLSLPSRGAWIEITRKMGVRDPVIRCQTTTSEIGRLLGRDRRTIQREIKRGTVLQRRTNRYVSRNPEVPDYVDQPVYKADAGQRMKQERASNKGRGLKIGHDHKLASYLERQIANEGYSPDAALGKI